MREDLDGTTGGSRGDDLPSLGSDFGRTVSFETSDTLYEATNREKLKQKELERFQNLD